MKPYFENGVDVWQQNVIKNMYESVCVFITSINFDFRFFVFLSEK